MKELTVTKALRNPRALREALEKEPVRLLWKEQKPNGKVLFSAIATKEDK